MNRQIKSILFLILVLKQNTIAQTGTSGSPFTSIAQSSAVTTGGIYYFNLSGSTFRTFVSPYGWLLVANDFGGQTASNLSQISTLDLSTRGILTAAILGKLSGITFVGISSSDNIINITTSNSTIISRVINNQSLNIGAADNGLYGTPWLGTGSSNLNSQSCSCTDATTTLNAIYTTQLVMAANFTGCPTQRSWLKFGVRVSFLILLVLIYGLPVLLRFLHYLLN